MQTEIRMCLLAHDKASPSGYKIVGWIVSEQNAFANNYMTDRAEDLDGNDITHDPYHTHREKGIKIDDKWYYEGDLVCNEPTNPYGEIVTGGSGGYMVHYRPTSDVLSNAWLSLTSAIYSGAKVIGTIHDKEKTNDQI